MAALEEDYKEVLKALEFVSTRQQEKRLAQLTKNVSDLHERQWEAVDELLRMKAFFKHMEAFFPEGDN